MKLFCLGDEDTVRGFRLAGVRGESVATPTEAAAALTQALAQPDCALLVLTQQIARWLAPQLEALRQQTEQPLWVEIPGPAGRLSGRRSLAQLAQEALGLRLDPEKGAVDGTL